MAGDVKAAGDLVAQYTDIASRARKPQEANNAATQQARANEPKPGPAGSSDSVALTDTAATLKRAEQSLATVPVTDSAKVDRLRSEIANGTYEIDAQRIADKLVDMESSLSGTRT